MLWPGCTYKDTTPKHGDCIQLTCRISPLAHSKLHWVAPNQNPPKETRKDDLESNCSPGSYLLQMPPGSAGVPPKGSVTLWVRWKNCPHGTVLTVFHIGTPGFRCAGEFANGFFYKISGNYFNGWHFSTMWLGRRTEQVIPSKEWKHWCEKIFFCTNVTCVFSRFVSSKNKRF